MPDDTQPPAWHLLLLALIPAVGAGVGLLLNQAHSQPPPPLPDGATQNLVARLMAHRARLEAHLDPDTLRPPGGWAPQAAAQWAAKNALGRGVSLSPQERTRRTHEAALHAGIARQAALDAARDAVTTVRHLTDRGGPRPDRRALGRAHLIALGAGEEAAATALVEDASGSPQELMQRAYEAALRASNERLEQAW
jgi:hypothetical protein